MAIEVRVPEEIKDYQERIIAGLSLRQLFCGAIALTFGIPTYLFLDKVNTNLATYATMIIVVPAFCVGFIKKDGYPFEVWLKIRLASFFGKSQRSYETEANQLIPVEAEEYRQIGLQKLQEEKEAELTKNKRGEKNVPKTRQQEKNTTRKVKATKRAEYDLVEVTKESSERKRKTAYKSLKATARSNRKKKSKKEKTA